MILHGTSNVTPRKVKEFIMRDSQYFNDHFDVVSCLAFTISFHGINLDGIQPIVEDPNPDLLNVSVKGATLSYSGKQFPGYAGCGRCQHVLLSLALGIEKL